MSHKIPTITITVLASPDTPGRILSHNIKTTIMTMQYSVSRYLRLNLVSQNPNYNYDSASVSRYPGRNSSRSFMVDYTSVYVTAHEVLCLSNQVGWLRFPSIYPWYVRRWCFFVSERNLKSIKIHNIRKHLPFWYTWS